LYDAPLAGTASPKHGTASLMGRGRSSGVEHNLAKVGVEGSNPFARSRISQENQTLKKHPPGCFLLTCAMIQCLVSTREQFLGLGSVLEV
jgi:hypothetical protein